jgi:polysaccharide pyruvyl transferase WcaK-like protein
VRILVEPNAHHHQNMGDTAMLQVALRRLRKHWPTAQLEVITDDPARLARMEASAVPVPAAGRRAWFEDRLVGYGVHRRLPARARGQLRRREHALRRSRPHVVRGLMRAKHRLKRSPDEALERYLAAVDACELFVVTGAGAINDPFAPYAVTVLELIEHLARRDVPAAMVGQGIGPVTNVELRRLAARALPRLTLLGLRERWMSLPLATGFGVAADRLVVTGDAVERRRRT